jgi:hypothetical protein
MYFCNNKNARISILQVSVHASRGRKNVQRANTRQIDKADEEYK